MTCKYSGSQACVLLCGPWLSAHSRTSVPSTDGVWSELRSLCAALGQIMVCQSPQGRVPPGKRRDLQKNTEQMLPREVVAASSLELLKVRLDRAGAPWDRGRFPCPWQGAHGRGWNKISFKAPSIPKHSVVLCEGISTEGRDFPALSQTDMIGRGSLCLGEQELDAAQSWDWARSHSPALY